MGGGGGGDGGSGGGEEGLYLRGVAGLGLLSISNEIIASYIMFDFLSLSSLPRSRF